MPLQTRFNSFRSRSTVQLAHGRCLQVRPCQDGNYTRSPNTTADRRSGKGDRKAKRGQITILCCFMTLRLWFLCLHSKDHVCISTVYQVFSGSQWASPYPNMQLKCGCCRLESQQLGLRLQIEDLDPTYLISWGLKTQLAQLNKLEPRLSSHWLKALLGLK